MNPHSIPPDPVQIMQRTPIFGNKLFAKKRNFLKRLRSIMVSFSNLHWIIETTEQTCFVYTFGI